MRSLLTVALSLLFAGQTYPPPYPRTNATKVLETDRIAVWDMVWPKGEPTAMHRHVHDQVGTYYAPGGRLVTSPDGTKRTGFTNVGAVSTTLKGTTHIEEGATDPPLRAIFIELKQETPSGRPAPASEAPPVFPRDGAKQLLDNERVTLWDYTWRGTPAHAYQHTHDAVVVWLDKGKIRLTPKGGAPSVVDTAAGQVRYVTQGTVETAEFVEGTPRAFVFEIK